ncbi:MAG: hypothetical protein IKZ58_04135 [Selenomonadaceae bacterium]|nr:hypothetical protein [Selenomonadaceae bacterium]
MGGSDPNSKVYIICPGGVRSDGAELCHRLCSQLIRLKVDAHLVYIPITKDFDPDNPVYPPYKYFRAPYTYEVEDATQNILIVPESLTSYLYTLKNIRRVIWWLSVDNLFRDIAIQAVNHLNKALSSPMVKFFCFQKHDEDIEHWTQSEYAKLFLKVNKVPDEKIYHIGDYINPMPVKANNKVDFKRKKNTIAYNAATSSKIMPKLIAAFPKVNWIAIQDTQAEGVQKLLEDAKIYVDFGDFVYKETLPRYAAVMGCVVITGKHGAAANKVDINIPPEFKFEDTEENLPQIEKKIRDVLADYKGAYAKQKNFLDKIINEQKNFNRNVAMTLGIKSKTETEPAAIFNGLNETGVAVAEIMLQNEVGLEIEYVINDNKNNLRNPAMNILYENDDVFLVLDNDLREQKLPIITSDEARFLYNEGRIKKIIMLTADKEEEDFVKKNIQPLKEDIISTSFDE